MAASRSSFEASPIYVEYFLNNFNSIFRMPAFPVTASAVRFNSMCEMPVVTRHGALARIVAARGIALK